MRRRLDRLFTFARAAENSPLENFTTEALACAIERDPGPLLRMLPPEVADVTAFRGFHDLHVDAQVSVPAGIVDLVVEVIVDGDDDETDRRHRADAMNSGHRQAATRRSPQHRRHETGDAEDVRPSASGRSTVPVGM